MKLIDLVLRSYATGAVGGMLFNYFESAESPATMKFSNGEEVVIPRSVWAWGSGMVFPIQLCYYYIRNKYSS